jgi:IS30 family transposase
MLAQGHTETEIAQLLHVHVSTISRDVKVLKELSQRFVFDLAKGDLTYYYKQCIDGMDEIRREAWSLYKYGDWSQGVHLTVKEKLATLKLLKECNEAKFALLEKGPSVLNVKGMEEKLYNILNRQAPILPS